MWILQGWEIQSFLSWFFAWICFCSLTLQWAACWTGRDLAQPTCRGNISSIREEIVEGSSSFTRQHTTDFKAVMRYFERCSQPKRKLILLICGWHWINMIINCPFIFWSSLHIELAKSSKLKIKDMCLYIAWLWWLWLRQDRFGPNRETL